MQWRHPFFIYLHKKDEFTLIDIQFYLFVITVAAALAFSFGDFLSQSNYITYTIRHLGY